MIVAAAIFVVGLVLAIRDFPRSISDLRLTPLLLSLLVGVPATMLLLAADFVLQARFAGAKVTFRRALEITLVGNAANMLPLPAGAAPTSGGWCSEHVGCLGYTPEMPDHEVFRR